MYCFHYLCHEEAAIIKSLRGGFKKYQVMDDVLDRCEPLRYNVYVLSHVTHTLALLTHCVFTTASCRHC